MLYFKDKNYVNTQIKRKRHNGCLFASEYKFENIVTKNITFDGRRRNSKDIINSKLNIWSLILILD